MALSVETINRLWASGRNYVSMGLGLIGGIGLMSVAQQHDFMDALNEIGTGLAMIFHGAASAWQILIVVFPALTVITAKIASNSAKLTSQAPQVLAAVKDPNTPVPPEVKQIIKVTAQEVTHV